MTDTFHEGERFFQKQTGMGETIQTLGSRVIRPYMTDQHINFFKNLAFIYIGGEDSKGDVWASIFYTPGQCIVINDPTVLKFSHPCSTDFSPSEYVGLLKDDPLFVP